MSKADTWMPLHVGDYLSDTGHLRTVEHGAYFLLLLHYWRNGPLPDDDARLAAIARLSRKDWLDVADAIRQFFTLQHGRLHQKRADMERAKAASLSDKRRSVAEARWGTKTKQTECKDDAIASPIAEQEHVLDTLPDRSRDLNPNLPSETSSLRSDGPREKPKRARPRTPIPPDWMPTEGGVVYAEERGIQPDRTRVSFVNHHQARGNLMANWDAAWRTWCDNEVKFGRAPGGRPLADALIEPDPWGLQAWEAQQRAGTA